MTTAPTHHATLGAASAESEREPLRVIITDKYEQSGIDGLREEGCEVLCDPDLTPETLPDAIRAHDPDVLIVRSTKVPAAALEAARSLSLVIRAGAGYDNIDVAAASARGIFVANCPGKNAVAVAELAWGLILACDRRIPDQTADLRAGKWDKKGYGKAAGLQGRTLGIVGLGRIGQEIAARGRAFGMRVIAWSRSLTQARADELQVGYCSSLINLAKMSDVVSLNVAANDETRHLVNDKFLGAMREGATLVNTSRGSVVDGEALVEAIRSRGIRAGLDVWSRQPAATDTTFDDPVIREPHVYGTHHCGASTEQAQDAIAREVCTIIRSYQASGAVPNCVNRAASTPATTLLTIRHHNRPGVLAHVFYTLGQAGINVEEMENIIYEGAEAACARIQLDTAPSPEHLNAISTNEHVLSIDLATLSKSVPPPHDREMT